MGPQLLGAVLMATREVSQVASAAQTRRDNEAQGATGQLLKQSQAAGLLRGEFGSATGTAAGTKISHNLKRQPEGWIVVDITGAATVFRSAWDTFSVTLTASADVAVRILIF